MKHMCIRFISKICRNMKTLLFTSSIMAMKSVYTDVKKMILAAEIEFL
jgi:hypothetical protein